jgi:hypothetical protein
MNLRPAPAIFVVLALCATAARADFFGSGYYTPINGQVGRELISDAAFNVGDIPAGCVVVWKTISVSGALPPGLSPPGANVTLVAQTRDTNGIPLPNAEVPDIAASAFSGTPSKAGDWPVTVVFHDMACSGAQSYGDRSIKVNFHISP